MFSAIIEFFQKLEEYKLKRQKKLTKQELKKEEENQKKIQEENKEVDVLEAKNKAKKSKKVVESKEKEKKSRIKIIVLNVIKWIVTIIENFITWIISLIGIYGFLIILVVIVLMIAIYGLLHIDMSQLQFGLKNSLYNEECLTKPFASGSTDFDISQISQNMGAMTPGDKQAAEILTMYNEIMSKDLSSVVENSTYINSVRDKLGTAKLIYFLYGFGAIENTGGLRNIPVSRSGGSLFEYSSTQSGTYAFMGLHNCNDFSGIYKYTSGVTGIRVLKDSYVNEVKGKYTPKDSPSVPNNFMPYGVSTQVGVVSCNYLVNQFDNINNQLDPIMDQYGITNNRDKLKAYIQLFASAAAYHSGGGTTMNSTYREGLFSAWCALWSCTSDDDAKRDFDNIRIVYTDFNYTEPQTRPYVFGDNNFYMTWGAQKSGYFEINGKSVDTVLWDWVSKNCSNPTYFNSTAKKWLDDMQGPVNGGSDTKLTDSSYGPVAYLIGKHLSEHLGASAPLHSGGNPEDCPPNGANEEIGLNHTIKHENGVNTLKNLLAIAMKPVGECMYSWGGGRDKYMYSSAELISPNWKTFYDSAVVKEKQGITYNFKNYCPYPDTSSASLQNGLDCSGFVGWAVTNNREQVGSNASYTLLASDYYKYANWGWGSKILKGSIGGSYKPGDIMYNSGHVWMVVGPSEKGGIVFVHASPDGVQLNGFGGGEATAKEYMDKYWPEFGNMNFGKTNYAADYAYQTSYDMFRWNILDSSDNSGKGIKDPDGFVNKTAEQILDYLFNPPQNSTLVGKGEYKNTKGEPQGVWNIGGTQKTTKQLIQEMQVGSSWGKVSNLTDAGKRRIEAFVPYMGDAVHAEGGSPTCGNTEMAKRVLTETKFKAPYYHQGSGGDESWGNLVSGSNLTNPDSGSTFNHNGCHIYALSYALTVTQQRLINPPEALVLGWYGGLWSGGMGGDDNVNNFKDTFGLNITTPSDDLTNGKKEVDEILDKNGVAIVYLLPPFAGTQHWVCITERVSENGTDKYKIWTSTTISQMFQTYTFDYLYSKKATSNWIRMGVMP